MPSRIVVQPSGVLRPGVLRMTALAALAGAALAACATPSPTVPVGPAPGTFNVADFAWSAASGSGAVHGRVAYAPGGAPHACIASVGLTPDTPYTRARFRTLYGSVEQAAIPVAVVRSRDVPDPNSDYRSYVRSVPCADNRFSFTDLPDGSWFLIAPVRAEGGEPIVLMRRVETRGGRAMEVVL